MQNQLSAAFSLYIVWSHERQALTPQKSTEFLSLLVAGPSFLTVFINNSFLRMALCAF